MKECDFINHPLIFVEQLASRFEIRELSFSQYLHRPQSIFDERVVFKIDPGSLGIKWLSEQLRSLPSGWELALNSDVIDKRGKKKHIGMIDFVGRPDRAKLTERVRNLLGPEIARSIVFYDSGRSFHGYVPMVMGRQDWHVFLARLLLMNLPGEDAIVDARWVGHRLIGGYSALRWSANSAQHSTFPFKLS